MFNTKLLVIAFLLVVVILSVGISYYGNSQQQKLKETVCYPQYLSAVNGEVVEIRSEYCEEVQD